MFTKNLLLTALMFSLPVASYATPTQPQAASSIYALRIFNNIATKQEISYKVHLFGGQESRGTIYPGDDQGQTFPIKIPNDATGKQVEIELIDSAGHLLWAGYINHYPNEYYIVNSHLENRYLVDENILTNINTLAIDIHN